MSDERRSLVERLLDAYDDYCFRLAVWWHRPPRRSERLDRLLDARDDFVFRQRRKWQRFRQRFAGLGQLFDPVRALLFKAGYWWFQARGRHQWLNRLVAPFEAAAFKVGLWWHQVVPRQIQLWVQSRDRRHFYRGIPALAALAILLAAVGLARTLSHQALLKTYRTQASNAFAAQDYVTARTCYERLLALGDDPEYTCLSLARTVERQGEFAYAAVLWRRLAPGDQPGYVPAHLARAHELLGGPEPGVPDRRAAERQLRLALEAIAEKQALEPPEWVREQLQFQQVEALTRLGELYFYEQDNAKAEDHLRRAIAMETPRDLVDARQEHNKSILLATRARAVLGKLYAREDPPKYKQAEVHLRIAAASTPRNDPDWLELQALTGRIYVGSEIYEEAEPILERAVAARRPPEPASVEVHSLLGQVYLFNGHTQKAEEQFRRALDLEQPPQRATVEALTHLGQILLNDGRYPEAEKHLDRAARLRHLDRPSAVLAQMLLGKLLLRTNRLAEAEGALSAAVRAEIPSKPAHIEAQALLGQLYEIQGRIEEAVDLLKVVVEVRPEVGLALGRMLLRQGEKAQAHQYARRALVYFRERAQANLYDQEARLRWAETAVLLDRHADGVGVLSGGLDPLPVPAVLSLLRRDWDSVVVYAQHAALAARQAPVYRVELARLYQTGLQATELTPEAALDQRLAFLEQVMLHEPKDLDVLGRLLRLVQAKGEERDQLQAAARAGKEKGTSPVLSSIVLACDALAAGKADEARPLLDEAIRRGPNAALALNNLAWMLAQLDAQEAPRALALMNAVLARYPLQPNFLDTRGQIQAKLGKWDAARTDLESALPGLTSKQGAHRTLAEVYKQLGNAAKAAEHERSAGKPAP